MVRIIRQNFLRFTIPSPNHRSNNENKNMRRKSSAPIHSIELERRTRHLVYPNSHNSFHICTHKKTSISPDKNRRRRIRTRQSTRPNRLVLGSITHDCFFRKSNRILRRRFMEMAPQHNLRSILLSIRTLHLLSILLNLRRRRRRLVRIPRRNTSNHNNSSTINSIYTSSYKTQRNTLITST